MFGTLSFSYKIQHLCLRFGSITTIWSLWLRTKFQRQQKGKWGICGFLLLVMTACQVPASQPAISADATGNVSGTALKSIAQTNRQDTLSGQFLAGLFAMYQRDLDVAADFLTKALAKDPDNVDLLLRVTHVMVQEGRFDEAEPLAKKLILQGYDDLSSRFVLIVQAALDDDFKTADSWLQDMPDSRLYQVVVPLIRAWILAGQGKTDEALTQFTALSKTPLVPLRFVHTAMINDVAGGRNQAAETAYLEALSALDTPPLRLTQLIGNFYRRTERPERAQAVYNQFMADNVGNEIIAPLIVETKAGTIPVALIPNAKIGLAHSMFDLATALRQDRGSDAALIFSRMAIALQPDSSLGQMLLAEILESQSRYDAAIAVYQKISLEQPFGWEAQLRMAELLDREKHIDKALKVLDTLAVTYPKRWEPLHRKGDVLRGHDRFAEAVTAYDGSLSRINQLNTQHWSLLYARGIALERSKKWKRAEKDFLQALKFKPKQPFVLNYLGYSWVEKGENLERALGMIQEAVRQRPRDGYIIDSLGWAYYKLGKFAHAVIELERATALRPHDPTINDHLGDAYWQVGRTNEARYQWQRALGLDPEPALHKTLLDKIKNGLGKRVPTKKASIIWQAG